MVGYSRAQAFADPSHADQGRLGDDGLRTQETSAEEGGQAHLDSLEEE
jgi:hypothetical protein